LSYLDDLIWGVRDIYSGLTQLANRRGMMFPTTQFRLTDSPSSNWTKVELAFTEETGTLAASAGATTVLTLDTVEEGGGYPFEAEVIAWDSTGGQMAAYGARSVIRWCYRASAGSTQIVTPTDTDYTWSPDVEGASVSGLAFSEIVSSNAVAVQITPPTAVGVSYIARARYRRLP